MDTQTTNIQNLNQGSPTGEMGSTSGTIPTSEMGSTSEMIPSGEETPTMTPEENSMESISMASEQGDQMREDLKKQFNDVKNKEGEFQSKQFINKNKLKQFKVELLDKIFSSMQSLGIDPNDLDSINQFLQKLEQQDPDLLTLFENAINGLSEGLENSNPLGGETVMGGNQPSQEQPAPEPEGLMSKYKNLQNQILRK